MIRDAHPDEHAVLTALALTSKAHWGYDAEFMAACVDELTLTPEIIGERVMLVAERDGRVTGMAGLAWTDGEMELCDMFVDPAEIGTGLGRKLFEAVVERARKTGEARFTIDADPNALDFYQRMGARLVGMTPSQSIPGRELPHLIYDL
ncbi:MAG: GNAT family N-acetyltransferase [Minwuia sp.]|uniref:GNAT family N-acetyltransferase n=1 Tax=Minwuia sp. TaxID=2493630 RepID=UPI003A85B65D